MLKYQRIASGRHSWYARPQFDEKQPNSGWLAIHSQAVGFEDQTVRIISLDPESTLETISLQVCGLTFIFLKCSFTAAYTQALTAQPVSICIAEMLDAGIDKNQPTTFVNIGLVNGVLLRTVLDPIQGSLTDTRTR